MDAVNAMPDADGIDLELDDIQSGALHERPSPYVGTYLLLRIDDRAAGRELVRRLHRLVDSRPAVRRSRARRVDHRRLHLPRPGGARGAAGLAGQLRAGVPAGDGGARGRAGRRRREQPGALGAAARQRRRPRRPRGALARRGAARGRARAGAPRPPGAARRRGDLAPGLLPAPDRAHLVRLQGRDRPAGGRGQRHARRRTRRSEPLKAGEIILGYPDETGELPPMPTPEVLGRNGTYVVFRKLHTKVAAYRQYLRDQGGQPRGGGAARREDGRALAERRAARALPGPRRSRARRRPAPQQRLPLRRRPARLQVPRRRARPAREPARRARPRRQRRRPPAPHDPARHELRPDAARGRARGRRRRPRASSSCSPARTSKRQFEFVKTQWLNDGIFIGAPAEKDPLVGPNDGSGSLHHPAAADPAPAAGACRRSWSPAAASTASPRACGRMRWLAELDT